MSGPRSAAGLALAVALASPAAAAEQCASDVECEDGCKLPDANVARSSKRLLAIDASAVSLPKMEFMSFGFPPEWRRQWEINGVFHGPCLELRAVFLSGTFREAGQARGVDVYQLVYGSESAARRVAERIPRYWYWNKHPIAVYRDGASVFVVEGRHDHAEEPGKVVKRLKGASRE